MIIIGAILSLVALFFSSQFLPAFGNVTTDTANVTRDTYRFYQFFATTTAQTNFATTTTATSTNIAQWVTTDGQIDKGMFVVAGSKKVTMYFTRAGTMGNEGSTTYKVQISPNGTTWYDFEKLVQATSTTVTNATIQTTAIISAATTTLRFGLEKNYEAVYAVRCIVVETTDGEHSCAASAEY